MDGEYNLIKEIYLLLDDGDRQFLKQFDVTPIQLYALLWLDGLPGKSLSQLSRDLLCDPANVTRLVRQMEEKELLTRRRDSEDRRVVWVSLTPKGQQVCEQLRQAHMEYTRERMSVLTQVEQAQLRALLKKLKEGLKQRLYPNTG
ncbi:MAG: MarR family winged helix-turn-helix transcriptional regulator [Anaerolineales bacterium]